MHFSLSYSLTSSLPFRIYHSLSPFVLLTSWFFFFSFLMLPHFYWFLFSPLHPIAPAAVILRALLLRLSISSSSLMVITSFLSFSTVFSWYSATTTFRPVETLTEVVWCKQRSLFWLLFFLIARWFFRLLPFKKADEQLQKLRVPHYRSVKSTNIGEAATGSIFIFFNLCFLIMLLIVN